ncbi:hypothetical protein HHL19_18970 [Streptomyces sp. R302]|uniref:golvesin C-terminal-like domain-containing protein n=1 Tax=unclassified Streptomyces TaxID=2593676 RepID=UPI00145D51B9|nr:MULTISPECIES: hypothetical protein [unclassified Streptomyces]NML54738.1 hypothetical protein [Streptomyces sp. R301]NML80693.1 hypothetical protein [Streptomyces sp. R302]
MQKVGKPKPHDIPAGDRSRVLGKNWKGSKDVAWTTSGDAQGFHLLTARESGGYAWTTTASLSEPGFDTDAWIGNACVTGSGKHAVVVYAPRTFTNEPKLMARGAFAAVVELESGKVNKLPIQVSLSYYNPGCGVGEKAVLTQSGGEDKAATRLFKLDAPTGQLSTAIQVQGQVTSSIPTTDGSVVGASGAQIVKINDQGVKTVLTNTDSSPYSLTPDADGGVVFLDQPVASSRSGLSAQPRKTRAKRIAAGQIAHPKGTAARPAILAEGPLTESGLTSNAGTVYLTGDSRPVAAGKLPRTVRRLAQAPQNARVTTGARAVLTETAWSDGQGALIRYDGGDQDRPVDVTMSVLGSGQKAAFTIDPDARTSPHIAEGAERTPALKGSKATEGETSARSSLAAVGSEASSIGDRNEIVESERTCSVPRNDPRNQAMQPKPRQVEWAVNQAIRGVLNNHISRPANWKNLGMPAYQPQTLFPVPELEGGGTIPAQVMLGITAQESNMWQASRVAVPGVTANPLIGNYYGIDLYDGDSANDWDINWAEADCGYGITQVTDHMRMAGREGGKGGNAWDYQIQRAVALDYTANVAAGLQILADKWNTTRRAGLKVNNGNPAKLENWTFALWAYNSGFYENTGSGEPWGVGWANNPANPEWYAGRAPFMEDGFGNEDAADAAHPQDWPYQEKVLGFAAHPPAFLESPGTMVPAFRAAWWNGTAGDATVSGSAKQNRAKVKPPEALFCTTANSCDPSKISNSASNSGMTGPCTRTDFKCWWSQPVQWKADCDYSCGNDFTRFPVTWAEEPDGTAYPPNCSTAGLPAGALIVDDVPQGTPVVRAGCDNSSWINKGTFTLDFGDGETGCEVCYLRWPAKVDLHQLGAGFGGHFYFGHTRKDDAKGQRLKITANWKLNQTLSSAAEVFVHLPDHGAQTQDAYYEVKTAHGWVKTPPVNQLHQGEKGKNRWVSIGAYQFKGAAPEVRLDTLSASGTGDADVAFDAVAFVPGDYSGTPDISFPDPDLTAPDVDLEDQPMVSVPTPPMNFAWPTGVLSSQPATRMASPLQVTRDAAWDSCPVGATTYDRYTACLKSSTPLTFVILKDGMRMEAKFNVDQQIQLYKNESSIDERITITPVKVDPALKTIRLEWRTDCAGPCNSGAVTWLGTPTWAPGDTHSVTAGRGHWWTGTSGVGTVSLTSILTGISPEGGATTTWSDSSLDIRCDVIMGKEEVPETKPGCVFSSYKPTLPIDTKKYPAAAAFYWLMMEKLETHPGKSPGHPLSRQADEATAKANRAKMCPDSWVGEPNGTADKPSCDEYPFAKSRQSGGQSVTGDECAQFYSVKENGRWKLKYDENSPLPSWKEVCGRAAIPLTQNTGAGGQLGRFTTAMRLHDEDEYFVSTPGFENCNQTICQLP